MKIILGLIFSMSIILANNQILLNYKDVTLSQNEILLKGYNFQKYSYSQNLNNLLVIFLDKYFYETVIKKAEFYSEIKTNLKKHKFYSKKNPYVKIKINIEEFQKLFYKKTKIEEKTIEDFYKKNQKKYITDKAITVYYLLAKNDKQLESIRNALIYTSDITKIIQKIALKNKQKNYILNWGNKQSYSKFLKDNFVFDNLFKLKKLSILPYDINYKQEKAILILKNKKESFKVKLSTIKPIIIKTIKETIFTNKYVNFLKSKVIPNVNYNKKLIKRISK